MRRSTFFNTSAETALYSGNEPIYNKKAIIYGHDSYSWNSRFVSLMDSFFQGKAIHNLTDLTGDLIAKYIAYANGTLPTNDPDYDLINQFDQFIATIQPQVNA